MTDKFDIRISNAERALLGLPLLCRVTVCCIKDQVPKDCGNWRGKIMQLVGRVSRHDKDGWKYPYEYCVMPINKTWCCYVMDVEILP